MKLPLLSRTSAWLPTVCVLLVVLLAGARLIMLSLDRHADDARRAARAELTERRTSIESQLAALAERASDEAARVSRALAGGATTVAPAHGTFRIEADGSVVRAPKVDRALATGIATEWSHLGASGEAARFLGPTRQGSQWIVAVRAPVAAAANRDDAAEPARGTVWAVAYADLDQLLDEAKVGRLVSRGYDFTFAQVDPATSLVRTYVNSGPVRLEDPMKVVLRTPAGLTRDRPGHLELAIQPREGWYPTSRLASEIGLLALTAWLLAFGTHDLIVRSQHLRQQLAASQEQARMLNEQLVAEIEERQDLQKSFEHARYHDAFTGLPNRRYFMDQLDRALRAVRARRRQGTAVALIEIDRLKLINETLGHAAGDELMVQAAHRFEEGAAGLESVLARWEGSQLALLLPDVPTSDAALQVANTMLECLREPFELRRHRIAVAASVGITCADSGLQRPEDLLREADIALSVAKRTEGIKAVAYAPSMGGDAASLVSLEADLHLALERNELRLLFQPVVDLHTRQTVGAEALLRWQHPVEGLLTPDKFLSIAEEAGLMVPITHWVIARVCKLAGEWRQRLDPGQPFFISVNLSAASLRDPFLAELVASLLARTRAPAAALKFEITEAGLINNVGEARAILRRLHDMGIELMLDDFGTGYSSLNHLELFPFDFVKIDRPFVSRLGADSANSGIMAAVVQIAASLGLRAIAEVIETQAVAQALQKMGCNYGQGFFFSAPVEAEEVLQRMRGREWTQAGEAPRDSGDDSPTLVLPMIYR
ncbi:MAG TPA: bifunctional diguanylate cyclase/phosphodiesterase [Steroidobacteraceae bacterium]|jgi:diguanylate cyclase (GGDEF)-like protein|nr:bifunctional diguanylate cyclase/phosphodiesterase [Steroidobacteraceae bacterium]